jgi:hypothetical protein
MNKFRRKAIDRIVKIYGYSKSEMKELLKLRGVIYDQVWLSEAAIRSQAKK